MEPEASILIVEDQALIAADVARVLDRKGYRVVGVANTGEAALQLAETHKPDLVMMDIVLKGELDGIETAAGLREKFGIPVVFLTAYADTKRLNRAKLTYPFGYLVKPVQEQDLLITVKMALFIARVESHRKAAEDLLKKYKQIVSSTLDGVSFINRNYRYVIVNDAYERILNISKEQIIGRKVEEVLGRDVFESVIKKNIDRSLRGETTKYDEWLDISATSRRYFNVTFCPYIDSEGNIEGVVANIRDITDQHEAEKALLESEEKYRQLYHHAPAGIYEIDLVRSRILDVNDVACDQMGRSRTQMLNSNPYDLLSPETWTDLLEHARIDSRGDGVAECLECEVPAENGRRICLQLAARLRYEEGKPVRALVVANDITNLKMLEKLARKNEERFRLIANKSVDSAFFHDNELKYVWLTKPFAALGIDRILGKNDLDLFGEKYGRELYDFKSEVLVRKEEMQAEFTMPATDGGSSYYKISCSPRTSLGGDVIGLSGFMHDITDRKLAEEGVRLREEQLREERKNLEEANAAFKLLLKHRDEEKQHARESMLQQVKNQVMPYIERLNNTNLDQSQQDLVGIIENSLLSVLPGFSAMEYNAFGNLTPKELQVANMVKMGHGSKKIAELLNISEQTVAFHRKNLRKKFGLTRKDQNLRSYLLKVSR